ncbi:hypothetical protein [Apilactobacillus timberlakei]|uniref:hypothetical protein n=1 Tax=Apilactobacillus timberlakei TaxID=2008380 RepID=UPI00112B83AF|nr:hypothetical protein [Apilactobacillus timberlakei]TPR12268.1 hypothetical protein DYZ97_07250 [Apilactobacillus timberlakei]
MAYKRIDTTNLFKNPKGKWEATIAFDHGEEITVHFNDDERSALLGTRLFSIDTLGMVEFTEYARFTTDQLKDITNLSESLKENTND